MEETVTLNEEAIKLVVDEIVKKYAGKSIDEEELTQKCKNMTIQEMEKVFVSVKEAGIIIEEKEEDKINLPSVESTSDDSVKIYLKDIGQVPLLTGDEEIKLAITTIRKRYKEGIFAAVTPSSIQWKFSYLVEHLIEEKEWYLRNQKGRA